MISRQLFVRDVRLEPAEMPREGYPFAIPAIRALDTLALEAVTFLVGENGSGKSTLLEAIAIAAGFNAEGGSRNYNFATRRTESELHSHLRLVRGVRRPRDGFFLRAESFYNVATEIERLGVQDTVGGISPHEQSHGESFLSLAVNRFRENGLYLLDEPEAALSPQRQLSLLAIFHRLARAGSQFIVATHSPILLAYPGALIYHLGADGIAPIRYEDTEHFTLIRDFLNDRERYFKHLFEP